MRQGVGNGQQQAVGCGQGRSQTTRRHQTRNHERQATDFRSSQHHNVTAQADFSQLQDAVFVDVSHRHQRGVDHVPACNPSRQLVHRRTDQQGVDVKLDQHRQGGRCEVQQRDEEQRPCHRLTRFTHRRYGVKAHQNVRQCGCTNHQTEHQGQEVLACNISGRFIFAWVWVSMPQGWRCTCRVGGACGGISRFCSRFIFG